MPTHTLAADQNLPDDYVSQDNTSDVEAPTVYKEAKDPAIFQQELDELAYEIVSLREKNVKHFRLADGTCQAVVYGEAVHRLNDEGEWKEINNALSDINGAIETNDSRVSFTKKITGNETLYTLKNGKYKVTVGLTGDKKKTEGIIRNNTVCEDGMTTLQKLINIENMSSSVTYRDILDGIDLEYIIISDSVKENIIVKEQRENYSFSFTLKLNNLTAKLENGNILLLDSKSEESIYTIPAPYMYDTLGNESTAVEYSLIDLNNGKYEFTLIADPNWIDSSDRAFPVVIDPSFVDIGQIDDTYVSSSSKSSNYGGEHYAFVSSASEAYFRFATPNLPPDISIVSASIRMPYYYDVTGDISTTVDLFELTSDWNESAVTWNNKPSMKSTRFSTASMYNNGATVSDPNYATFSVTDYVKSWYNSQNNYGFAAKRTGGTANSVKLATKEGSYYTQLTIVYSGTPIAEGVFVIKLGNNTRYMKSYNADGLSWVLQRTELLSVDSLNASNLDCVFKISYRPDHDDYVIRSMLDNSLVIYPSIDNNAPIGGHRTESDSQLSTLFTWKIEYSGGYHYITHTLNGTKYYLKSKSTNNNDNLILTTNPNDSGVKWYFERYTGDVFEDIEPIDFDYYLTVNETHQYRACMRSTRIGHNGPVNYSVKSTNNSATDKATINSTTGELTALKEGTVKVWVTYPGAPWIWVWTISIEGYASADMAATAFMNETYAATAYILHEFGTKIYSRVAPDGVVYYDYGTIVLGEPHSVNLSSSVIPDDATYIATAHTHPHGNSFSNTDVHNAKQRNKNSYIAGPSLAVKIYNVSTQTITTFAIATPKALSDEQKAALVTEFRESWNAHVNSYQTALCPHNQDCKNMAWPTS